MPPRFEGVGTEPPFRCIRFLPLVGPSGRGEAFPDIVSITRTAILVMQPTLRSADTCTEMVQALYRQDVVTLELRYECRRLKFRVCFNSIGADRYFFVNAASGHVRRALAE